MDGRIRGFQDLTVWRLGKELAVRMHGLTEAFPRSEAYGLTNQIRRAAVSVPANIAEGFGRFHFPDKIKFFLNARGSLNELKSHILIAAEVGLVEEAITAETCALIDDLGIRLNNLIAATRRTRTRQ